MKNYNIYIRSNEHPRTINTPMMGRDALEAKVAELIKAGKHITEVCTDLGTPVGPNDRAKFEK